MKKDLKIFNSSKITTIEIEGDRIQHEKSIPRTQTKEYNSIELPVQKMSTIEAVFTNYSK